jgi:hypothetical protein
MSASTSQGYHSDNEGSKYLWNVDKYLPAYTDQRPEGSRL